MSLPWFRLYRELKDDPKIGLLDDSTFRVFIESLCWACEKGDNGRTGLTEDNANWAFRRNVTKQLHDLFHKSLLVKNNEGEIMVPKWEDRQKRSDLSTPRVRDYRNRTKNNKETVSETFQKRNETVQEEKRGEENRRDKTPTLKLSDDEWFEALKGKFPALDLDCERRKAEAWLLLNPKRQFTRRFFTNWISRAETPIQLKSVQKKFVL